MEARRKKALYELMKTIGVSGIDIKLLHQALIHPSYAVEKQAEGDNQRLEFLGDAVIDLLMGHYLYHQFPTYDEGKLTKMRASLVCEEALAEAALKLGLNNYLLLGRGETLSGGATRPSNLADAWEAVCGAIYLSCGVDALKEMVLLYLSQAIQRVNDGYYGDYKTRLQEFIQRTPGREVEYILLDESGPAHDRVFFVEVQIDGESFGQGKGKSKKIAQREAAMKALMKCGELPPVGKNS